MKKQKRRIQRPSYKAAATDLANRLNKAEDDLLVMRRDLSIATSQLHQATLKIDELENQNRQTVEAKDRDGAMRQKAVDFLAEELERVKKELVERENELDQSRAVSIVMCTGWRLELAAESEHLDVCDLRDAFTESEIDPKNLHVELMVALMGSYSILMSGELKKLK